MTSAEYQRERRARIAREAGRTPGRPGPKVSQPCGTVAAYKRHTRRQEPPCEACRKAWAEWQRDYYKRKRQR